MKLHWLQHVPFEGLGYIEEWAAARGTERSCTRLFSGEPLPELDTFDWLIVMGGPMGIHHHDEHPWLVDEKEFIRQSIDAGKTILGICLGAQLLADVLGAKVYPGPQKEIGWFPIQRSHNAPELIPKELTVFHWHGDTFDLPENAVQLASSQPRINQGFVYEARVIGLQFHMETTQDSLNALIEHCGHELMDADNSPYIQSAETMRKGLPTINKINQAMEHLLNTLASRTQSQPK